MNDGIHLIMSVMSPITIAAGESMCRYQPHTDVQEQRTTTGTISFIVSVGESSLPLTLLKYTSALLEYSC